jgi:3-phosphoshikimate 1-carboxyvinyltransferase
MEILSLLAAPPALKGTVRLPLSKSHVNRLQVLKALFPEAVPFGLTLDSEDTEALNRALQTPAGKEVSVGPSGTAMRFAAACFALWPGTRSLSGNDRMNQRPMEALVQALRHLGAEVQCTHREGFAPLTIGGGQLHQATLTLPGDVSSQFFSALALIAPAIPGGLTLQWNSRLVSRPYLEMTIALLQAGGCQAMMGSDQVVIPGTPLHRPLPPPERDWSAAAFWFMMASLIPEVDVLLEGLHLESIQGDAALPTYFEPLGVWAAQEIGGVRLTKTSRRDPAAFDLIHHPDLAQPLAFAFGLAGVPLQLTGLDTLVRKETNRIQALEAELGQWGVQTASDASSLEITAFRDELQPTGPRPTYGDHRMAMAMAAGSVCGPVQLLEPGVVSKSYPGYWKELRRMGFQLTIES